MGVDWGVSDKKIGSKGVHRQSNSILRTNKEVCLLPPKIDPAAYNEDQGESTGTARGGNSDG